MWGRLYLIIMAACVSLCSGTWSPLSGLSYHCWPDFVTDNDPVPFPTCVGVSASWLVSPPDSPGGGRLDVSFRVTVVTADFYPWAVDVDSHNQFKLNFFSDAGHSTAGAAQTYCGTSCSDSSLAATAASCCVHGVAVRICPRQHHRTFQPPCNGTAYEATPANGQRSLTADTWSATLTDLASLEGEHAVVAHVEIGGMILTLSKNISLPKGSPTWFIVLIVAVVLLGLALLAGLIYYFHQTGLLSLPSLSGGQVYAPVNKIVIHDWRINSEDLAEDHSHKHGLFGSNTSIVAPETQDVVSKRHNFVHTAIHGKFGKVAVRKVRKQYMEVDEDLRREFMRTIHIAHPNICRIYGAVIELGNVCIVSEFCQKHGLDDVLTTEEIPLTWDFRLHFAQDICHGVEYLHSKRIFHGHLKTSNCLVDEKWIVKVSDWGLSSVRVEDADPDQLAALKRHAADRIYRAPELSDMFDHEPTAEGDVYAFGIILTEIATRRPPNQDKDPEKLSPYWKPPPPNLNIQPAEDEDVCPCAWEILDMIDECLQDVPNLRPTCEKLSSILNRLYPTRQNPLQISVSMLERYSRSLEVVVAEKIQACEEEKHRVIKLMSHFAPKSMVDKLYHGMVPTAKGYGLCTVYFSDIVGFTTLASLSAPCEVVNTLNLLYHTMDAVIRRYNALTVELITDAYLIVSGVPEPSTTHALELARMAVDMVDVCKAFVIPHRASEKLKVRIGLHSGPLSGGIVGNVVPKFCVFGETINVASKMGSTGKANRIHISEFTYDLLCMTSDEFQYERRGTVPFKGRQEMTTWWLTKREPTPETDHSTASISMIASVESSEVILKSEDITGDNSQNNRGREVDRLPSPSGDDVVV